jgi:hypothetical protein
MSDLHGFIHKLVTGTYRLAICPFLSHPTCFINCLIAINLYKPYKAYEYLLSYLFVL